MEQEVQIKIINHLRGITSGLEFTLEEKRRGLDGYASFPYIAKKGSKQTIVFHKWFQNSTITFIADKDMIIEVKNHSYLHVMDFDIHYPDITIVESGHGRLYNALILIFLALLLYGSMLFTIVRSIVLLRCR